MVKEWEYEEDEFIENPEFIDGILDTVCNILEDCEFEGCLGKENYRKIKALIELNILTQKERDDLLFICLWQPFKTNQLIRLLIDNGANPDHEIEEGITPLMIISNMNHLGYAKLFLDIGANPNFTNEDGESPISLAYEAGNMPMYELLKGSTSFP